MVTTAPDVDTARQTTAFLFYHRISSRVAGSVLVGLVDEEDIREPDDNLQVLSQQIELPFVLSDFVLD
ncbi:MAG TPA: hypothetical protein VFO40_17140 [Chthoniobacterales bacterium]|nr:hypothetical protein [Chthoniobacterales bacterium]